MQRELCAVRFNSLRPHEKSVMFSCKSGNNVKVKTRRHDVHNEENTILLYLYITHLNSFVTLTMLSQTNRNLVEFCSFHGHNIFL